MASFLQVEQLTKSFGDLTLFENISFGINSGERVGLIAKNGAGKTTLLNILAGKESYDNGIISFQNDLRVAYLEQSPLFPPNITVIEACFHSNSEVVQLIAAYELAMAHENHENLDTILSRMEQLNAWDYEQKAKQILTQLKITDFDQPISQLSGGQLKRIALANVLLEEPDLLILDEPTNHLDLEMTEWLEEYLRRNNLSLLMVTHDRYFLDRVCNEIIEIDDKKLYIYKGNYSYYLEKRDERIESQNAETERARNLYRKELEWMRRQPQARATKAKARKEDFYKTEEKAKQGVKQGNVSLAVKASYIGSKIFEIEHLSKSFDKIHILDDFTYTFARYEKMGVVGNNGTGKSTFIKMLIGEVTPDSGTIDVGETVRFGYYSQDGLLFDNNQKVIDAVRNIAEEISLGNGTKLTASQFLQYFLFTPETQHNYIYKLSGGEKRRLYLCTVLISNPNFLILDEPTNDLDIVTLNVLEEYLRNFKGCVIVVSHDRYFMDKVVDHLLVFRGNAQLKDFPGNYTDYREWKEEIEIQEKELEKKEKAKIEKKEAKTTSNTPIKNAQSTKTTRSYKEQREFDAIEKALPLLESEKTAIEIELCSGKLSNELLTEKSQRIAQVIEEIENKTMRWLELSELS